MVEIQAILQSRYDIDYIESIALFSFFVKNIPLTIRSSTSFLARLDKEKGNSYTLFMSSMTHTLREFQAVRTRRGVSFSFCSKALTTGISDIMMYLAVWSIIVRF